MSSFLGGLFKRGLSKFAGTIGKKAVGRMASAGIKNAGSRLLSMGRKQVGKIGHNLKEQAIEKLKDVATEQGKAFVGRIGNKIKNSIEKGGTNINSVAEIAKAVAPVANRIAPQVSQFLRPPSASASLNQQNAYNAQVARQLASRKR